MEATPNTMASTNASPNTIEAVLPTHATLDVALLSMPSAPFLAGRSAKGNPAP